MQFTCLKHKTTLAPWLKAFWVSTDMSLAFPMEAFNTPLVKPSPANFAVPKRKMSNV